MSRGFIGLGTGIAACMSTVALAFCPGGFAYMRGIIAVTSIATAAIGLRVAKLRKEESQTLDTKDWILIGGAGVLGSLLGSAAMVTCAHACSYLMVSTVSQVLKSLD